MFAGGQFQATLGLALARNLESISESNSSTRTATEFMGAARFFSESGFGGRWSERLDLRFTLSEPTGSYGHVLRAIAILTAGAAEDQPRKAPMASEVCQKLSFPHTDVSTKNSACAYRKSYLRPKAAGP